MSDEEEDLCEEEIILLKEINGLKDQLDAARCKVQDTDFFAMTEAVPELGRVKYKASVPLRGHVGYVNDLHWTQDSRHLLTVSKDTHMFVWDTFQGCKEFVIDLTSEWNSKCAYSPSGGLAACGGIDEMCLIYSLEKMLSGEESSCSTISQTLANVHTNYISGIRFVDDRTVMTSSGDKSCVLWDIERGSALRTFRAHSQDVLSFEFQNQFYHCFVSTSSDSSSRLWDTRLEKACVQLFEGHAAAVTGVGFYPNSAYGFFTSSEDHSCRLWDIRADQQIAIYQDGIVKDSVNCVTATNSGRLLLAGYDDQNLHVWDVLREERVGIMPAHEGRVVAVGLPPSGYCVASCANDSKVYLWTSK